MKRLLEIKNNIKKTSCQHCIYFMAGYDLNMNILVSNINHLGQKDFSFEVRHKAYACPLGASNPKH